LNPPDREAAITGVLSLLILRGDHMDITVETGSLAYVANTSVIDASRFGFRFTGFREFDRFVEQTGQAHGGLIGWPGGYIVEDRPDLFGFEYPGLVSDTARIPSVQDMIAHANQTGQGLAVTLPTMNWLEDPEAIRAHVRAFMEDLLGGTWGPLPETFIIELGSEYYAHLSHGELSSAEAAPLYGRLAEVMIEEIAAAESDPTVNLVQGDVQIAIQGGRNEDCACRIHGELSPDALSQIDYVTMSRMPLYFSGVDRGMADYDRSLETWTEAIEGAGGHAPSIFMVSFNAASPTRAEAATAYIEAMAGQGVIVTRDDLDLDGRSNAAFEQFWQDRLDRMDIGPDQPRVLMELFAEFHEAGMTAGTAFGVDQVHPGRLSYEDTQGTPQSLLGMDFLGMLYETVDGTHMLDISTQNTASTPYGVYGFEGPDHLTLFVMGNDQTGDVHLTMDGLGSEYTMVWAESLTPSVPDDWHAQYGVPVTEGVDQTPEAFTYADGQRAAVDVTIDETGLGFDITAPGQVVRLVLARTPEGEEAVQQWIGPDAAVVDLLDDVVLDPDTDPDPGGDPDPNDPADDQTDTSGGEGDFLGGLLLMLLPLLALAGLG
jgi:hypothetical protein